MSVAEAGAPFTNPKNGPKSRLAEKPVTYHPVRLVPNASSSTGNPSTHAMRPFNPAK